MFGIPAGTAATIIFTVGLLGAFVFTPLVALLADRTNSRWGKFRPWILWTAVPFGVLALLAFSTPDPGPQGKVFYAATTYTLLVLVYAASNLPYSALSGVLTGSMAERNSVSAYRFVAVMIAQLMVQSLLLPLVLILGGGDKVQASTTRCCCSRWSVRSSCWSPSSPRASASCRRRSRSPASPRTCATCSATGRGWSCCC